MNDEWQKRQQQIDRNLKLAERFLMAAAICIGISVVLQLIRLLAG